MNAFAALALMLAVSTPATRAGSPWNGTWKLDRARSHLTGSTITLSKADGGRWRYSDGTISYGFALDGKPVATWSPEATMAATGDGVHAIDLLFRQKGAESRVHLVLSADGRTITEHSTGTRADGSKTEESGEMERVGTGSGFAGTWRSTKTESSSAESFVLAIDGERVKWDWPANREALEVRIDGSDLAVTGSGAPSGVTLAIRKVSATKLAYTSKGGGKVLGQGTLELPADGRMITDTSWTPAKPNEKTIAVYLKQ